MEINLGFSPDNLKPDNEAYPAFMAGGMTLKFWALWKRSHITDQTFRDLLSEMGRAYYEMFDDHAYGDCESKYKPYRNIDEFVQFLRMVVINSKCQCIVLGSPHDKKWLVKHWDYFSLSIQRQVSLKYKVLKEVEEIRSC